MQQNLKVFNALITVLTAMLGISEEECRKALMTIAKENGYNPVQEMLDSIVWDGQDRITSLISNIIGVKTELEAVYIRRWLHQCLSMAFNSETEPYGAEGLLVLIGKPASGKTLLFSKLAINKELFLTGGHVDDKNSVLYWITELNDFDKFDISKASKASNESTIQEFIKAHEDTCYSPYEAKNIVKARRTSFCAGINKTQSLPEFSECFWVVDASNMDTNRIKALDEEWVKQLWRQVYEELYLPNPQGFRARAAETASTVGKADTVETVETVETATQQ